MLWYANDTPSPPLVLGVFSSPNNSTKKVLRREFLQFFLMILFFFCSEKLVSCFCSWIIRIKLKSKVVPSKWEKIKIFFVNDLRIIFFSNYFPRLVMFPKGEAKEVSLKAVLRWFRCAIYVTTVTTNFEINIMISLKKPLLIFILYSL